MMVSAASSLSGLEPIVSVIMPAYNAAVYIRESIDSILKQSLADLELIVVDDGSTDGTAELVSAVVDKRLIYIRHTTNQGVVAARNTAIELARGRYIALLDADDVAAIDRLAKQVAVLDAGYADICAAAHVSWNTETGRKKIGHQYRSDSDIKALLSVYCPLCNSAVMAAAAVLKTHRYDEQFRYAEDYELWTRLAMAGLRFVAIDEPLVTYRVYAAQMSQQQGAALRLGFDKAREKYLISMGLSLDILPQALYWRERMRLAPKFLMALRRKFGRLSLRANYEIYARYQFRGNGWLTIFTRLERLIVATYASWFPI
jgi:glycosyltransferase involved in cell wall biosynthesis